MELLLPVAALLEPSHKLSLTSFTCRHWRELMVITGRELNLAQDALKLQHLLDANLLGHRRVLLLLLLVALLWAVSWAARSRQGGTLLCCTGLAALLTALPPACLLLPPYNAAGTRWRNCARRR